MLMTVRADLFLPRIQKWANESTMNLYTSFLFKSTVLVFQHSDNPWKIKLKDFVSTDRLRT